MEWLLDVDQLARANAVASLPLTAGHACGAPAADPDAVYGGLAINVDAAIFSGWLHAMNGVTYGQLRDGTWLRAASDMTEAEAFAAGAATPLGSALDWLRAADRDRAAFWSRQGRPYPLCPQPHSAYVDLTSASAKTPALAGAWPAAT